MDNTIYLISAFGIALIPLNLFLVTCEHVWVYAIAQFVMVVLAGRLFYSLFEYGGQTKEADSFSAYHVMV